MTTSVRDDAAGPVVSSQPQTPRSADPETFALVRAIQRNLGWVDLVRIASQRRGGWICWKWSGRVEHLRPCPKNGPYAGFLFARAWKSKRTNILRPDYTGAFRDEHGDYKAVELDEESKRPRVIMRPNGFVDSWIVTHPDGIVVTGMTEEASEALGRNFAADHGYTFSREK